MGELGFLIRNDISHLAQTIEQTDQTTEALWIKLETKEPITIGVIYGQQENAQTDKIETQFEELTTCINQYKRNSKVIIMGDLNAKININKPSTRQTASRNGQHLEQMLENTGTQTLNNSPNHTGTWTRINRNNPEEKSIIDYIIIDNRLTPHIIESNTDDRDIYIIKGKKRTDHNAVTASIRVMNQKTTKKVKKWKKGTPQQWQQFNEHIKTVWD